MTSSRSFSALIPLAALTLVALGCASGGGEPSNYCGAGADMQCCTVGGVAPMGVSVNSDGCASGLMCDGSTQTCQNVGVAECGSEGGVCCSTGAACVDASHSCSAGRCVAPGTPAPTLRTLRMSRTTGGSVTFTSSTCPASYTTCQGDFPDGQTVIMEATAAEGYRLASWLNAPAGCDASSTRCSVTMTQDYDIRVIFEEIPVVGATQRQLRLSRTGAGSVRTQDGHCDVSGDIACIHDYAHGSSVTLQATPDAGQRVRFWGVSGCDAAEPVCTFTMDRGRTIEVAFEATASEEYRLNISREEGGTFSVEARSCPFPTCTPTYRAGETAVVIASPSGGNRLARWNLMPSDVSCSASSNRCEIAMDRERDLRIEFETGTTMTTQRTLNVSRSDGGTFSVTGSSCPGSTCAATFSDGATATINASPSSGYRIDRWEGATSCGTSATCNVLMDGDKTVRVVFTTTASSTDHQLEVTRSSGGTFEIRGYFCPSSTCSQSVPGGESVTIDATPSAGYRVARWEGATSCGTSTSCTFTMSADRTVNIVFESTTGSGPHTLDVSRTAGGTFQITGRSCPGSTCTQEYTSGSSATIVASPSSGYSIHSWEGAPSCGTNTSCTLSMDRDYTVRIVFQVDGGPTTRTLDVSRSSGGTFGIVGRSCPGSTCTQTYMDGESATITASPSSGYSIARWEGVSGCGSNTTCTVTMNRDYDITVVFDTVVTGGRTLRIIDATVPATNGSGGSWDSDGSAADVQIEAQLVTIGGTTVAETITSTRTNASGTTSFGHDAFDLTDDELDFYTLVLLGIDVDDGPDDVFCSAGGSPSDLMDGAVHTISCTDAGVSMPIRVQLR